jgi:hypothetical protein
MQKLLAEDCYKKINFSGKMLFWHGNFKIFCGVIKVLMLCRRVDFQAIQLPFFSKNSLHKNVEKAQGRTK